MKQKIAIIGVGNMGKAMARMLEKTHGKENLFLCDRNDNPNKAITPADIVILAVKPQSFDELAGSISAKLDEKPVISVMAGVTIKKISDKLGAKKVVRAMPNLPLQTESGVIGWKAGKGVTKEEKQAVSEMFSVFGKSIELSGESMLDAITVLSGSGPAYFFYMTELLEEKAKALGFSEKDARKIAEGTFLGSAKLLAANSKTAKEWRKAVTSKGGTTEAVMNHLQKNGFGKIFHDALEAAKNRAEKLSG